jgi:hypothetical protein
MKNRDLMCIRIYVLIYALTSSDSINIVANSVFFSSLVILPGGSSQGYFFDCKMWHYPEYGIYYYKVTITSKEKKSGEFLMSL